MTSSTGADLPVPDDTFAAMENFLDDVNDAEEHGTMSHDYSHHARAIAAPCVAAELRAWADRVGGYEGSRMRARADALDADAR